MTQGKRTVKEFWIDSRLPSEDLRKLWEVLIIWLVKHTDRFHVELVKELYMTDPFHDWEGRLNREEKTRQIPKILKEIFSSTPVELENIIGEVTLSLTKVLLETEIPDDASLTGEIVPFNVIELYLGETRLYHSYDYGTTQILCLDNEEWGDLCRYIVSRGQSNSAIKPLPLEEADNSL